MTEPGNGAPWQGPLERLGGRGDELLRRLADDLERWSCAGEARGRLGGIERAARSRLDLAAGEEVSQLRERLAEVERRLAQLEEASGAAPRGPL